MKELVSFIIYLTLVFICPVNTEPILSGEPTVQVFPDAAQIGVKIGGYSLKSHSKKYDPLDLEVS